MIIGAKRILEIVKQFNNLELHVTDEKLLKEIKTICERWMDIHEHDGKASTFHSLTNVVLKKQLYLNYSLQDGLSITCLYAPSSARAEFIATVEDNPEAPFPAEEAIERSFIKIDVETAISMAHQILGDKKPVIINDDNNSELYLRIMNNLQGIIENQSATIDNLTERLSE